MREARLLTFVGQCFRRAGCDDEHADLIARLLVNNDLRGVRSHASRTAGGYCAGFADGAYNPAPQVRVVHETAAVAVLDGDGTLGYLPTVRAAEQAVAKARAVGVGVGLVRHIGHYGSSGHYTRICLEAGCVGYSVQGYRGEATPKDPPRNVADSGNPPYSFAFPTREEEPIVVDAGAAFDCPFPQAADFEAVARQFPAPFFKSMGMIAASTIIGGMLTGFTAPESDAVQRRWPGAQMGGTVIALDPDVIDDGARFRREVDRYVRDLCGGHLPVPGTDRARLPGHIEAERMASYRRHGIPLGAREQEAMRAMHERWAVPLPWDDDEEAP